MSDFQDENSIALILVIVVSLELWKDCGGTLPKKSLSCFGMIQEWVINQQQFDTIEFLLPGFCMENRNVFPRLQRQS